MDSISEHLAQLSDGLDKAGQTKCADIVDNLIQNKSVVKLAQYVGVIGYVLKQNRAMGNCIRKKRASSTSSMQEVVLDCLKEYQDGQEYGNDNEWTKKYAQIIQQIPEKFETLGPEFLNILSEENQIDSHIDNIKKAHFLLKENNINDDLIESAIKDIKKLENRKKE